MGIGLSMRSRAEVTTRYAKAYVKAGNKLDLQSSHPGVADGVSYSLGEPEAGRVMRQMRADADAARRVHGLGADDDDDD